MIWNFAGEEQAQLRNMYDGLNQYMWWLMVYKTVGDANKKVMSCTTGEGLEAYRKVSHWYYTISAGLIGDLRMRVLKPTPATKEEDIGRMVEKWREDFVKLSSMTTRVIEDEYQVAALRSILCGTLRKEVDVEVSKTKQEPELAPLLAQVRR